MNSPRTYTPAQHRNNQRQLESISQPLACKTNEEKELNDGQPAFPMNKCVSFGKVHPILKDKRNLDQHSHNTGPSQNLLNDKRLSYENSFASTTNPINQIQASPHEPTVVRHSQKYTQYLNPSYLSFELPNDEKQTSAPSTTQMLPSTTEKQGNCLNSNFNNHEQGKNEYSGGIARSSSRNGPMQRQSQTSNSANQFSQPFTQIKAGDFRNQAKQVEKKYTKIDSLRTSNLQMEESAVESGIKFLQQKYRKKSPENKKKNEIQKKASHPLPSRTQQKDHHQQQLRSQNYFQLSSQSIPSPIHRQQTISMPFHDDKYARQFTDSRHKHHTQHRVTSPASQQDGGLTRWLLGLALDEQPYCSSAAFSRIENSQSKYYLNPSPLLDSKPDQNEFQSLFFGLTQNSLGLSNHEMSSNRSMSKGADNREKLSVFDPAEYWRLPTTNVTNSYGPTARELYDHSKSNNMKTTSMSLSEKHLLNEPATEFDNFPSFNGKNRNKQLFAPNTQMHNNHVNHDERNSDLMGDRSKRNRQSGRSGQEHESDQISMNISEEAQWREHDNNQLQHNPANAIDQYYTDKDIPNKFNGKKGGRVGSKQTKRPVSRPKSMTYSVGSNQVNNVDFNKQVDINRGSPNLNQKQHMSNVKNSGIKSEEDLRIESCINKQAKISNEATRNVNQPIYNNVLSPRAYKIVFQNKEFRVGEGYQFNASKVYSGYPYHNPMTVPSLEPQRVYTRGEQVKNKPSRAASSAARFFNSEQQNMRPPSNMCTNAQDTPIPGKPAISQPQNWVKHYGPPLSPNNTSMGFPQNAMNQYFRNHHQPPQLEPSMRLQTESSNNHHYRGAHPSSSPAHKRRGIEVIDKGIKMVSQPQNYMVRSAQQGHQPNNRTNNPREKMISPPSRVDYYS